MSKLTWTIEGKSIVSAWGTYGLRVKRLAKGRYWWILTGLLAPDSKRQVKVKDGMARCSKEGRNELQAALCSVSQEYRKEFVSARVALLPWYRVGKDFKPRVGRYLIGV